MAEESQQSQKHNEKTEDGEINALAVALGVLYATGVATSNFALSFCGLSDFSILKPKAIFAGALALLSLLLCGSGPTLLIGVFRERERDTPEQKRRLASLKWIAISLFALSVGCLIAAQRLPAFDPLGLEGWSVDDHPRITAIEQASVLIGKMVLMSTLALTLFINTLVKYRKLRARSFAGNATRIPDLAVSLSGGVLFLGYFIYLFSGNYWLRLPQQIGGGRPQVSRLIISKDGLAAAPMLKADEPAGDFRITQGVFILSETDDTLGIVYVGRKPGGFQLVRRGRKIRSYRMKFLAYNP